MWGAIIGAGISAAGSLLGGALSSSGASAANAANMAFNAQEAQKNRDWQEHMANTAYQRAMADMRAAGLNPMLAYQQGGAGLGSGAQATASFENTMEGLGQGVTSAGNLARNALDLQNTKQEINNKVSQEELNKANTALQTENINLVKQNIATSAAQANKANAEAALTTEELGSPQARRMLYGAQAHSAYQQGELNRRMVEDHKDWADSRLGREAAGLARVWSRMRKAASERIGDGGILMPNAMPGHNNPGLTIDVTK